VTVAEILAAVVAAGGEVALDDPSGAVLRIPPALRPLMLEHRAALRAVADRVQAFHAQLTAWTTAGRLVAPTFTLLGGPSPSGGCFSCGDVLPPDRPFRCHVCSVAVAIALGMPPR
jgi:hypothetical protein